MFAATLELHPLKLIEERVQTSFIVLVAIIVGSTLFFYWLLERFFSMMSLTQGNNAIQTLLWGLYQVRKTKTITVKG